MSTTPTFTQICETLKGAENVAAVEAIVKLYEHMEAKNAEKEFAKAFVALQSELPAITANAFPPWWDRKTT